MKFEWEIIHKSYSAGIGGSNTARAKVEGGWLVSVDIYTDKKRDTERNLSTAVTFVSDPQHKWEITND